MSAFSAPDLTLPVLTGREASAEDLARFERAKEAARISTDPRWARRIVEDAAPKGEG